MSREVRLQCADCARFVYVAGRAEDPYVCPACRGAAVVEPSDDLAAQLAAVTAERDQLAARLAIGFATHLTPTLSLESAVAMARPPESVGEDRDRLAADLTALREAVTGFVGAIQGHDADPVIYCDMCFDVATTAVHATLDGNFAYCEQHREPFHIDSEYAPVWRRLVAMVRPPEPDPGPAPGTVAWFDQARADLAAEGTPVDAADWLIGLGED